MNKEITQTEYDAEIEQIAREALKGEREYGQDAGDTAWETVDSHRWIIYTSYAMQIPSLAYSDGADLLDGQDLGSTYLESGLDGLHSLIAFACMYEDVQAKIFELRNEYEEKWAAEDAEETAD